MRHFTTSLLVLLGVTVATIPKSHAQNADRKTAIGLSGSAYQYKGNYGSNFWDLGEAHGGPGFSINRYLTPGLDLGLHLGYVEFKGNQPGFAANTFSTNVVTGNLALKLKLNNGSILKEDAIVQPYLLLAPGLAFMSREGVIRNQRTDANDVHFDIFGAAGINFRLSDGLGLFIQTGQHVPLSGNIDGEPNRDDNSFDDRFLQHTVGLNIAFGKPKDTDMDGVPDRKDKCPNTPSGVAVDPTGCPLDGDADGVPDYQDKCPTEKGLANLEGCPDRDSDGVRDGDDKCPDTPGKVELQGCPDADNDGVADPNDKCPGTPAGVAVDANGCPLVLDQDTDGVVDSLDRCPDTPAGARVDANGCPRVVNPKIKALERPIRFKTNSTIIERSSYPALNKMVRVLKDSTDYSLRITGHADSRGTDEYNQGLSERRAEAVRQYFTSRGIDASRILTEGRGESEPAAPNTSPTNMSRNRRVEFKFDFVPTPAPLP